jgi:hypothetical protein
MTDESWRWGGGSIDKKTSLPVINLNCAGFLAFYG